MDEPATESAGSPGTHPRCPICGGVEFDREEGRLDSLWGMTSHVMILLVCVRCRFVLHFYDSNSIFDFD
jgi:uncharacterized protein